MGFFKSSKKEIPAELPDLALNPEKADNNSQVQNYQSSMNSNNQPKLSFQTNRPFSQANRVEISKLLDTNATDKLPLVKQAQQVDDAENVESEELTEGDFSPAMKLPANMQQDDDKGFFRDLINNLVKETKNIEKVESFYNNKFMEEDIVSQMRTYWDEQKPEMMLRNVGKDLKEKIIIQSNKLTVLEKQWQDFYLALLSKEEEIRAEEKDLKESISEFISVYKKANKKNKK